jgi:hypothetical protein
MYRDFLIRRVQIIFLCFTVVFLFMLVGMVITKSAHIAPYEVPKAEASYQFAVTGGARVTGTAPAILGVTAAATEGVNMGDWRGAIADDNLHFGITSTAAGYNAYLDIAGVELNNANQLIIQTEFDLDATIPTTLIQICDYVSSTGVNAVADAQCPGGGWRNLNLNDAVINTATPSTYAFHVHNGYWNNTATTSINTPLANFTGASSTIRIRYFSTTNTTSVVHIDYLRVHAVINPIYQASAAIQLNGGTILGDYTQTLFGGVGQTGIDGVHFRVPGTVGSISDFYLSYDEVRTYPGANTILLRASYSCSATGINHRPKIYNFTTGLWEDLTTASIACSTTVTTNAWAKHNVTISDYVSNGEIRIGWYGLSNGTQEIRIDMAYVTLGTTNSDSQGEVSFGSVSAGTVDNTHTLDMTGTASTWNILSANESNTQAFAMYGNDSDNDTVLEEASAANINFDLTVPARSTVTGIFYAGRFMSGTQGTVQLGLKDYANITGVLGGWTAVGAGGTTALTYTDNVVTNTAASGGSAGYNINPEDHHDTVNDKMNLRLRTSAAGASTTNSVAQWDFAMVSVQWVEPRNEPSLTFSISDTTIGFGSLFSGVTNFATSDTLGSVSTNTIAHTLTAATDSVNGYVITLDGTTLSSGVLIIEPIGSMSTNATVGEEQFGLRATTTSGTGTVVSPYNSNEQFAFATSSFPDVLATGLGDNQVSIYDIQYMANIAPATESGSYTGRVTYYITGLY